MPPPRAQTTTAMCEARSVLGALCSRRIASRPAIGSGYELTAPPGVAPSTTYLPRDCRCSRGRATYLLTPTPCHRTSLVKLKKYETLLIPRGRLTRRSCSVPASVVSMGKRAPRSHKSTPEECAASDNLLRLFRSTPPEHVLSRAKDRRAAMTAEAARAHKDWSSQDAVHAAKAGASGWSAAGLGQALELRGVGSLEGVQSVCSMGSGLLATVAADTAQLRQRGALSAHDSRFTAVDIIALPESEALPPGVIFQHVCRARPNLCQQPTPSPPRPSPKCRILAGALWRCRGG